MSKILSIYCARKSKEADAENKYIFGDIFVLTTVDKLISIGRGAQDHFLAPDFAWPDILGEERFKDPFENVLPVSFSGPVMSFPLQKDWTKL